MDTTNTASNQLVRETVAPGLSTVAEIMSVSVRSLTPDRPIADAVAAFNEYGFRHMLIVDETGGLVGVLSDRDVLRAMARGVSGTATVSQVMSRGGITVTPESPITDAHRPGRVPSHQLSSGGGCERRPARSADDDGPARRAARDTPSAAAARPRLGDRPETASRVGDGQRECRPVDDDRRRAAAGEAGAANVAEHERVRRERASAASCQPGVLTRDVVPRRLRRPRHDVRVIHRTPHARSLPIPTRDAVSGRLGSWSPRRVRRACRARPR